LRTPGRARGTAGKHLVAQSRKRQFGSDRLGPCSPVTSRFGRSGRLRPGERQSQPARGASQEGTGRKRFQESDQALIGQCGGLILLLASRRSLSFRPQRERHRNVAAKPLQQPELSVRRNTQHPSNRIALRAFGQKAFEGGPAQPAAERLPTLRERA